MTRQGIRGLALVMGILLGATGAAQAEETGIAEIHSWVKMGRKTCMADHYHSGTGNAETRGQAERQAIQPALIEALTALGDKILLGEVASNMNLVSLFKGKDVATIFQDVVGNTKVGRTIAAMLPGKEEKKY